MYVRQKVACFSSGLLRPAGVLEKGLAWEEGEAPGSDPSPSPHQL